MCEVPLAANRGLSRRRHTQRSIDGSATSSMQGRTILKWTASIMNSQRRFGGRRRQANSHGRL
jgi:hypothetical protein